MKDQIEERSSQLLRNLSSCEKKAWKKFRLEQDSNPWLSFHNCWSCVVTARIFLLFDISSAAQNICFKYLHLFIHPSWVYYELTIWPAPSWLDTCSSIGRALHRHRRGHGLESHSSINFFQAFFSQLLKLHSNCEDLSSIWKIIKLKISGTWTCTRWIKEHISPYFFMCSLPAFPNIWGVIGAAASPSLFTITSKCLSIGGVRSWY